MVFSWLVNIFYFFSAQRATWTFFWSTIYVESLCPRWVGNTGIKVREAHIKEIWEGLLKAFFFLHSSLGRVCLFFWVLVMT